MIWSACAIAFCLCVPAFLLPASAQKNPDFVLSEPRPFVQIDLSDLGYRGLSRAARFDFDANVSLDFVDANHLLLTFNQKRLFRRLRECTRDHDDRLVRAMVLEIPQATVVTQAIWYLHDHRRYLWPLNYGQFLLRKGNDLYIVDSTLHEKLLMSSAKPLWWVAVTPDRRQVIVETALYTNAVPYEKSDSGLPEERRGTKPRFQLQFLDLATLAPQRTIFLKAPIHLDGTRAGYSDFVRKGNLWLIRFGPSAGERKNLIRLRSQATPRIFYSTSNSVLIGENSGPPKDYFNLASFTLTGRRLWRQRLDRARYFPTLVSTENQSRFAFSSLTAVSGATDPASDNDDLSEDNLPDDFEQNVQVMETASGRPVISLHVSPAIQSGGNVALSPDGHTMAALQSSALSLYELPPAPEQESILLAALGDEALSEEAAKLQADPATGLDTVADNAPKETIAIDSDLVQGSETAEDGKLTETAEKYPVEDSLSSTHPPDAARKIDGVSQRLQSRRSRPLHFSARVAPAEEKPRREAKLTSKNTNSPSSAGPQRYGIEFDIETADLRFRTQNRGFHHTELNLSIESYAKDGTALGSASAVWTSDLNAEDYHSILDQGVHISGVFVVPSQAASLRLGIEDKFSDHLGMIEIPLRLSAPSNEPPAAKNLLPEMEPD